jgi:hypothetical protein
MTRGGAAAARVAHNHEVAGSSPAPATKKTITSVTTTGVFVYPKSPKELVGSSLAWLNGALCIAPTLSGRIAYCTKIG